MNRQPHRLSRRKMTVSTVALVVTFSLAGCGAGTASTVTSSAITTGTGSSAPLSSTPVTAASTTSATSTSLTSSSSLLSTAPTGATGTTVTSSAQASAFPQSTRNTAASTTARSLGSQPVTTASSASTSASVGAQGSSVSSPFFNFQAPGGWTFDGLSTGGQGGGLAVAQWTSADKQSHMAVTASGNSFAEQQSILSGRGPWTSGPSPIQVGPLQGQVATLLSNSSSTSSVARAVFDTGGATFGVVNSVTVDLTTSASGSQRDAVLQQFQTALKSLSVP